MPQVTVDFSQIEGKIKPMHATNNGPIKGIGFGGADANGFALWKSAGIPFARTHDSSFCALYGGEHTVDVHAVFPNFNADVNNPSAYDFAVTDNYLKQIIECGSKVFYRLGTKIEHEVKKYNTLPPKDFKKWAEICEHIILHYTQGWADGFHYDIEYWEIWNEPDLDPEDSANKRTWGGTNKQFYAFYETVATHLKACFPKLKIGGPASAYREEWIEGFLKHLTHNKAPVPLDFFSWHCYGSTIEKIHNRSVWVRNKLNEYGYLTTESILNEWNYIKSWDEFAYSVRQITSIKGAAFNLAAMCKAQNTGLIDMLMYYDARPSAYNGLFDFYTYEPLKGYYSFKMFNELYQLENACSCSTNNNDIYVAAARNQTEKAAVICYFTDDDSAEMCDVLLDFGDEDSCFEMFLLDSEHNAESVGFISSGLKIKIMPNTVYLLKCM